MIIDYDMKSSYDGSDNEIDSGSDDDKFEKFSKKSDNNESEKSSKKSKKSSKKSN